MLLPLDRINFGAFSPNGEKFITAVGEDIYIFNTSDAYLSYKSTVPYDDKILESMKEKEFTPRGQTIDFVKFVGNEEIEIGRKISYIEKRDDLSISSPGNIPVNNSSILYVPTKTSARLSDKSSNESFPDFGCYGINKDGILVAKSRCEQVPQTK